MSLERCPQCTAEIVGRYHFCLECGAPLEIGKVLTPAPDPSPPQYGERDPNADAPAQVNPDFSPRVQGSGLASPIQEAEPVRQAPPMSSALLEKFQPTPAPFALSDNERTPPINRGMSSRDIEYLDLTLIRSPDLDSVRFVVKDHSIIGRTQGHLVFKDDPFISPKHATLFYQESGLYIRDEESLNGVFIRINEPTSVEVDEHFIAGEQVYKISDELSPIGRVIPEDDAQFFANSLKNISPVNLVQLLEHGVEGAVHGFVDSSITIGRQGCDVNAPLDRYMSSRHCHLSLIGENVILTDLGSKNGTFVKVKGERQLKVGDYILVGKQLLQVQPHQPGSRSKVAI